MHVLKEGSQLTSHKDANSSRLSLITVYQPYNISTIISTLEKSGSLATQCGVGDGLKKPQQVLGEECRGSSGSWALHLRAPKGKSVLGKITTSPNPQHPELRGGKNSYSVLNCLYFMNPFSLQGGGIKSHRALPLSPGKGERQAGGGSTGLVLGPNRCPSSPQVSEPSRKA